jgi:hypothetical protein
LFQLRKVRRNDDGIAADIDRQLMMLFDIGAVLQQRDSVVYRFADVCIGKRRRHRPGISEKVCDDAVQPVGLFQDYVHQVSLDRLGRHLGFEHLYRSTHRS